MLYCFFFRFEKFNSLFQTPQRGLKLLNLLRYVMIRSTNAFNCAIGCLI